MNKRIPVSKCSMSKRGDCRNPEIKVTTEQRPWYKGNTEEIAFWRIRGGDKELHLKNKPEFTRQEAGKSPPVVPGLVNVLSIYLALEYL